MFTEHRELIRAQLWFGCVETNVAGHANLVRCLLLRVRKVDQGCDNDSGNRLHIHIIQFFLLQSIQPQAVAKQFRNVHVTVDSVCPAPHIAVLRL
jgi:hypothetical protein